MRDGYLVFGAPEIFPADIESVVEVLRSGWIGTGPVAAELEAAFAAYVGAPYAVAVSSCTAALHLALVAAGVGPGDEVIVPALTFASTAGAVIQAGAEPVFADVDQETQCVTAETVEAAFTARTRAIIPVHFAGRPVDIVPILEFANRRGAVVVEDCAHAIEAQIDGRHAGTFGTFGTFSFYATKNVTTAEGGMLITRDEELAARARRLSLHGLDSDAWKRFSRAGFKHYEVLEAGLKANLPDLLAALGLSQLARVETSLRRREKIWDRYDAAFAGLPLETPLPPAGGHRHARHLYTVMVENRDVVMADLHARNIGTGVHYRALHLHPFYVGLGWRPGDFPGAEWVSDRTLSLPLSPGLSDRDVADVIAAVTAAVTR